MSTGLYLTVNKYSNLIKQTRTRIAESYIHIALEQRVFCDSMDTANDGKFMLLSLRYGFASIDEKTFFIRSKPFLSIFNF